MATYRAATTEKVTEMIQAHADELEQHGISGGLASARPAAGTDGVFYFSTDTGVWSRDNGTTWDDVSGLSESYINGLIAGLITTHTANATAHHDNSADHSNSLDHSNADDHPAPTYDSGTKEIVFQI